MSSMGKQSRNAGVCQDVGRNTAEDEFTVAGMAVGTHDQEIGGFITHCIEEQFSDGRRGTE